MKKCKICGAIFQYHVPNSHLEEHGITRKEYNELKTDDNLFFIPKREYSKTEDDIQNHIISMIMRSKKKKRLSTIKKEYI